jgi:hypothetical protein
MEELIDGGYPNISEPNLLKEMFDTPGSMGQSSGTVIVCFSFRCFYYFDLPIFSALVQPEASRVDVIPDLLAQIKGLIHAE